MNYEEIEGDLIQLALANKFDVIAHGCNCFCTMGAGIAPQIAKAFSADKFKKESPLYKGDINKLGTIDWQVYNLTDNCNTAIARVIFNDHGKKFIRVINAYTQYNYGSNHTDGTKKPLDYEALTLCLRKINHKFKGFHIGLPLIGCGLAGGDWEKVKNIIQSTLVGMNVTIVHYKPN